jgi:mannose-6-phosphate isomerase-like protein (cupin superfamily)
MRNRGHAALVLAAGIAACSATTHPGAGPTPAPMFVGYSELRWSRIIPDLGASSPEIAILRVDPTTQATDLMIRTPAAIHVRRHWHSANETHTMIRGTAVFACDGRQATLGPGSFNFMPAKMVHEAWLPADSLTFITVDRAWDIHWIEGPSTAADLNVTPRPR